MIARLRVGMNVFIREGSTERNLDELICGALRSGCCLDNISFCTDDKHPNEIRQEGHINYNVKRAIELGCPPIEAIKMATINAAKHFHLEGEIGSITPGRIADILLIDKLEDMFLNTLFPRTLSDQKFTCCPTSRYNDFLKNVTHTCSERKHQGVLMFIRPCTVFSIAAVRGVVKPDISVVKMSTLVTVIWISYNQKDIETVGYFYRMS